MGAAAGAVPPPLPGAVPGAVPAPLPPDEDRRLERLRALKLLDSPPQPIFDACTQLAALVCGTPIALVSLVDEHRQWFKSQVGLPGVEQTARDVAFCAHAILGDEIMEVPDALADSRFAGNPLVLGDPHIRFYAGAPLRLPDGAAVGTLCVVDRQPRCLSDTQRQMLRELARIASEALLLRDAGALDQAERALLDSEQKFRALSDSSPFGVFHTDATGQCTYTNTSWQQIYGLSFEQSLGDGWSRTLHEDDRDAVFARWQAASVEGRDFERAFRVRRPEGTVRHVKVRSRTLRSPDGSVTGHVGVVEDVTERLRDEAQLRDSRALLDHAGRLAGVGGWRVDLLTPEVQWSDQTCRIHDLPPGHKPSMAEAIGYYRGAAREAVQQAVAQAVEQGAGFELSQPMTTASGREIWVRVIGEPQMQNGRAVAILGAFHDVTAHRALEQAREASLARERQWYEQTPALLLSLDEQLRVRSVTDLWLARTGFERHEVLGQPLARFAVDPTQWQQPLSAVFDHGSCRHVAGRLARREGGELRVFMSALVERDHPGQPRRALVAFEDVTEAMLRSEQLDQEHALRLHIEHHAEELNRLLAERGAMLDMMAHEVRQPLNNASAALQSATALLAARGEIEASEQLRRAQAVLSTVLAGVSNTLAATTLLAGSGDAEFADTDLDMLVQIAIGDMPPGERGRIAVQRRTPVRTVWVDPALMRLALRNLLANALAFSPPDAPVDVVLNDADEPAALCIDVVDRGPGMPAELLPRLFQRGARGARRAQDNGPAGRSSHGLGLFIVRRAMELQGGQALLLASGPGGSTLRLLVNDSGAAE